jgi:hypothetical protein
MANSRANSKNGTSSDAPSSGDSDTDDFHKRLEALTKLVADQGAIQLKLQQDIVALTQVVNDQKAIVDAISREDSEGRRILALGNMDSTEFRQEMKGAIYRSLDEGDLIVVNKTTDPRELLVNGMSFLIEPSETKTIRVKAGTVTTELVGYETAKQWTINSPNFQQTIHIVPTTTATSGGRFEWVQLGTGWVLVHR